MIRKQIVLMLIILLIGFNSIAESEQTANADSTLMQLLALIPDTEHSRANMIAFADLEALDEAYGVQRPATWAEFETIDPDALDDPEMLKLAAWWHSFRNITLPGDFQQFILASEANTGLGFTYFEIDQAISFGSPPGTGLILVGDIAQDAVRAALQEKGYTQQDSAGAELWCGAAGCEAGTDTNLSTREVGNPFGGHLGRIQPVLIGESYLMSSAEIEVVENHIAAAADEQDSLADALRYQAAVQAVSQEGTLIQAMIFDQPLLSEMIPGDVVAILGERATPEVVAEFIRTQLEGTEEYRDLPVFDLMIVADTVTSDNQVAYIGLVYRDVEDAQTAAEVIPSRLETYVSIRANVPVSQILEERHITAQEPTIYQASDDLAVVLFAFTSPRPADLAELIATGQSERVPERPDLLAPGLVYRTFQQMVISRDFGWLNTMTRADMEALLQELEGN